MKYFNKVILFYFISLSYCFSQENFTIIANDIAISQMNPAEAKSIFKGKNTFWKNNRKVVLVLPSSKNPNSIDFSKYFYNTNPDGVKRYWLSLVFQGRSTSPIFLDSDKEIIEFITKNEGAIGVISNDNIKIVEDKFKINLIK